METNNNKIEWTIHLARKYPGKTAVILMILGIMVLSAISIKMTVMSIAVPFFLVITCGQFLFPIRYSINEYGIRRDILFLKAELKWERVKSISEDKDSIWLSEEGLKAFGGMLVHLPVEKDNIITYIKSHVREGNGS